MSTLTDIGNLMYLYLDSIDPGKETDAPQFLIHAAASILANNGGHNWVPVIVKETSEDHYQVIGNSFIYEVVKTAGLERVWCIIAEASPEAERISQVLARETIPKINLCTASRDDIKYGLEYLIEQPRSPLKSIKSLIVADKIEQADRQYWKNFDPITKLKCGITKGKKLDAIKQIFCLEPIAKAIPEPSNKTEIIEKIKPIEIIKEEVKTNTKPTKNLKLLTVQELKNMAKARGLSGYSKLKKAGLIKLLSS
ncbi:MAG TPA: Rho termination factor [Cyanothece sp. UBA12306]|nr:Rho termination factor [Cyanothece sp. UBA12306]